MSHVQQPKSHTGLSSAFSLIRRCIHSFSVAFDILWGTKSKKQKKREVIC